MNRTILPLAAILLVAASLFAPAAQAFPFECLFFPSRCETPKTPPFIPVFYNTSLNDGLGHSYELNTDYFASPATAQKVCQFLGCFYVFEHQPCSMGGGPASCSGPEYWLAFDGFTANAGLYAAYWRRNPENLYPGVAQRLAELQLFADRQAAGTLPHGFAHAEPTSGGRLTLPPIKGKRKR